jgi:hypothetical protein
MTLNIIKVINKKIRHPPRIKPRTPCAIKEFLNPHNEPSIMAKKKISTSIIKMNHKITLILWGRTKLVDLSIFFPHGDFFPYQLLPIAFE